MSLEGAQLICLDEDGNRGEIVVAQGRKFTVGYYVSCDFVLSDDRAKAVHCTIECDAFGRITIRNMCPEHPVLVNGATVENKRHLFNKSIISILDKRYLWEHSSHSAVDKEATSSKEVSTPKNQIGITEHTGFSSPGLKTKKCGSRFTVHNFAYCIQSDDDGNISVESNKNNESSDNMAEEKESSETTTRTERHSTPEPESENTSTACVQGTPQMNLLNCTNNKENTGSSQKKSRLQLSMCHQSEIVITSFSPRETGVRTEKSFTAILIPKVLVTRAPNTPKSVYSTPKSVLGDDDDEIDRSRDINFHTPSTSKKAGGGATTATKSLKNSSMHLVDYTTPKRLAPASPYLKSALKASAKKLPLTSTTEKNSKNTTAAEDLLGVSALHYTPVVSVDNKSKLETPNSVQSVISVDSTDTSSVIEILSDASTPGLSSAKTPQKAETHSTTPMRTPQSLMKRAILTNRNKQITTPQRGVANVQTTPHREPINRIPLRSSIGALRSPVTQKPTGPDVNTNKGQSVSTPSRMSLAASSPRFQSTPTTNTKFATPSPSRRVLMAKSACKATSTPLGTASYNRYSGCNTTPLNKVRKSLGGVPLSNHISKARKSIIQAAPSNFTSIKEKSPQQKMSDKILYRARKSVCVTPMVARAIQKVHAAKDTPNSIPKQSSHRKAMASSRSVLFDDKPNKAQTIDCSLTFILDSDDEEFNAKERKNNVEGNIIKSTDDTLPQEGGNTKKDKGSKPKESLSSLEKEQIINLTFSPRKVEETEQGEESPSTEEIPIDVDEVPQGVKKASDEDSLESINQQEDSLESINQEEDILTIGDSEDPDDSPLKQGQDNDDVIRVPLTSHATEESFAEEIIDTQKEELIQINESSKIVTATEALDLDSGKIDTGFGEEPKALIAEELSEGQNVLESKSISFIAIENKDISEMDAIKSHYVLDKSSHVYHPIYEDITLESSVIEKDVIDLSLLEHSKNVTADETKNNADETENNAEVSVSPKETVIDVQSTADNENNTILTSNAPLEKDFHNVQENDKDVLVTSTDKENPQHVSHTVLDSVIKDVGVELSNPETTRDTADVLEETERLPIEESTEGGAEQATTCKLLEEIEDVLNKSDEYNLKHLTKLDDNESIHKLPEEFESEKLTQDTNSRLEDNKHFENAEEISQKSHLESEETINTQETVSDTKHESEIEESISTSTNDFCQEPNLESEKIKKTQASSGSKNETAPKEFLLISGNEELIQKSNLECEENKDKKADSDSKTESEIKESIPTSSASAASGIDDIQALSDTKNESDVKESISTSANEELIQESNLESKIASENNDIQAISDTNNECNIEKSISTFSPNEELSQESNLKSAETKENDDMQVVDDSNNEIEIALMSRAKEDISQERNLEFEDLSQESNLECEESKGPQVASEKDDIQFVSDTENEREPKESISTSHTNEDLSQESNFEFEENEVKQVASHSKNDSEIEELIKKYPENNDRSQESNFESEESNGSQVASEMGDIQVVSDTNNESEIKESISTSHANENLCLESNLASEENKQAASDNKIESEKIEESISSTLANKDLNSNGKKDSIQAVFDTTKDGGIEESTVTSPAQEEISQESNLASEGTKDTQAASEMDDDKTVSYSKTESKIEESISKSLADEDLSVDSNLKLEDQKHSQAALEKDDIQDGVNSQNEMETEESTTTSSAIVELSQKNVLKFEESKDTQDVSEKDHISGVSGHKNQIAIEELVSKTSATEKPSQDCNLESEESNDTQDDTSDDKKEGENPVCGNNSEVQKYDHLSETDEGRAPPSHKLVESVKAVNTPRRRSGRCSVDVDSAGNIKLNLETSVSTATTHAADMENKSVEILTPRRTSRRKSTSAQLEVSSLKTPAETLIETDAGSALTPRRSSRKKSISAEICDSERVSTSLTPRRSTRRASMTVETTAPYTPTRTNTKSRRSSLSSVSETPLTSKRITRRRSSISMDADEAVKVVHETEESNDESTGIILEDIKEDMGAIIEEEEEESANCKETVVDETAKRSTVLETTNNEKVVHNNALIKERDDVEVVIEENLLFIGQHCAVQKGEQSTENTQTIEPTLGTVQDLIENKEDGDDVASKSKQGLSHEKASVAAVVDDPELVLTQDEENMAVVVNVSVQDLTEDEKIMHSGNVMLDKTQTSVHDLTHGECDIGEVVNVSIQDLTQDDESIRPADRDKSVQELTEGENVCEAGIEADIDLTEDEGEQIQSEEDMETLEVSDDDSIYDYGKEVQAPLTPKNQKYEGTMAETTKTPVITGVRKLLKTPKREQNTSKLGERCHLVRSPKHKSQETEEEKTGKLQGLQVIVKTPISEQSKEVGKDTQPATSSQETENDLRGVMKTPKVNSTPVLGGVKELLDTPKQDHESQSEHIKETNVDNVVGNYTERDLRGVKELLKTPKSCATPRFKGMRELLKTPKVSSTPVLGGVKELLDTPPQDHESQSERVEETNDDSESAATSQKGKNDMSDVKDVEEIENDNKEHSSAEPNEAERDIQVVKDLMKTPETCELLNAPIQVVEHIEEIEIDCATTSQEGGKDLREAKQLTSTPKACATPPFKGKRELLKTPKVSFTPLLSGVKELLDTPTQDHGSQSENIEEGSDVNEAEKDTEKYVRGAKELKTPKSCATPLFKGMRELLKTPKVSSTPGLGGVKELLDTPTQDHESQSESIEETNDDNESATTSQKRKNYMSDIKDVEEIKKDNKEHSSAEPNEAERDIQVVKDLMKTPETCELLNAPIQVVEHIEEIEVESATTSQEGGKDKEFISTPKSCATPRFKGIRELMKTPKVSFTPLLSGVKELLDTPKQEHGIKLEDVVEIKKGNQKPSSNPGVSSAFLLGDKYKELLDTHTQKSDDDEQFVLNESICEEDYRDCKDVKELMKTPKGCSTPRLKGIRELMKTPKLCPTPVLGGIKELMNTPKQDKGNFDKFLKTPTAKNIMIPSLPSSAVIEKREDSVEMVHSIEYDLNDTHEGGSANLGELFKTPVASRFVDRLSVSYGDDDHGQDCEEVNTSVKEGMVSPDLPTNSKDITANLQTPSRKVCRRNSLLLKAPLAESPFSAADVLTDMSRTEVEDWVDKIDPLEQTINLNNDDNVNKPSEDNKVIILYDFTASDSLSVVPETCVKLPLANDSTTSEAMINISAANKTTSKDPLERSTTGKSKQKNKRPITPSETADISGIDLLDETAESVLENSLVVSDDNENENSSDNNKSLNASSKQHDTLCEEESDNNLSEPLLLSDDDESEEYSKVVSKNEDDGKSTTLEPTEAAMGKDLSTNILESFAPKAPNVTEGNLSNKNIRNRECEDIFFNDSVTEEETTIECEIDSAVDSKEISEAMINKSKLVKSSVEKEPEKVSTTKQCEDIFMENSVSEISESVKDTNDDEADSDACTENEDDKFESLETVETPNDTKDTIEEEISAEGRTENEDKHVETADTLENPQGTCDVVSKILNENFSLSSQESKHQTSSTSVICLDTTNNEGDATQTEIKTLVADEVITEVIRVNETPSDLSECGEHKNDEVSEDVNSISESTTSEEVVQSEKTDEYNEQSSEFNKIANNERSEDVISIDDTSCEEVPEFTKKEGVAKIRIVNKETEDATTPEKSSDVDIRINTDTKLELQSNLKLQSKVNEEASDVILSSSEEILESKEEFMGKTTNFSESSEVSTESKNTYVEQTTSASDDKSSSSQDIPKICPKIQQIESKTSGLTDSSELDLITEGVELSTDAISLRIQSEPDSKNVVDNETELAPKVKTNKAMESDVEDTLKHEPSTSKPEKSNLIKESEKMQDSFENPITEKGFETSEISSSAILEETQSSETNSNAKNAEESSGQIQISTDKCEQKKVNEATKEVAVECEITDIGRNQTEALSSQSMSKSDIQSTSEIKGEDITETTETISFEASATNEASSCSENNKPKREKEELENQGEAQIIVDIPRELQPEEVQMDWDVSKSEEHASFNENMELEDTSTSLITETVKVYGIEVQIGEASESVIESGINEIGKNQTEVMSSDASSELDNKSASNITEKRDDTENTASELNLSSTETKSSSSETSRTQPDKMVTKSEAEKEEPSEHQEFEIFATVLKHSQSEIIQMESDVKKSYEESSSKEKAKCQMIPESTVKSYDIQVKIRDASVSVKGESTVANITLSESDEPPLQDKPTKRTQARKVSQSSVCSNDSDKEVPTIRRKRRNTKTENVTPQPEISNILHTVDEIENNEEEKTPIIVKIVVSEETDPNSDASTSRPESKTSNENLNKDHQGRVEPESGVSNVLLMKDAHQLVENKSDTQTEKNTVAGRKLSRRMTSQDTAHEINLKPTKSQRAGNRKVKFTENKDDAADGLDKIEEIEETSKTVSIEIDTMQYTEINPTETSEVINTPADHVKVKDTEMLKFEKTEPAKRTRRKPSQMESNSSETSSIFNEEAVEIIKEVSVVIQAAENTAKEADNTTQSSLTVKVGELNKRTRRKPSRTESKPDEAADIKEVIDESVVNAKKCVTEETPKIAEESETDLKNRQRKGSQEAPCPKNSPRRPHSTTEKESNEISKEQSQETEMSVTVHNLENTEAIGCVPTVQVEDEPKPARRTRRKASIDSAHEDDNATYSRKGSRRKGIEEKKLGMIEELDEKKTIDNTAIEESEKLSGSTEEPIDTITTKEEFSEVASKDTKEPHELGHKRSCRKASQDSDNEIGSKYTRKGSGRKAHLDHKEATVLDKIVEIEDKEHEEEQKTKELISEAHSDQIALKTVKEEKLTENIPEATTLSTIEMATHDSNESPDPVQKTRHHKPCQDSPTGDDKTSVRRKVSRRIVETKGEGEEHSTAASTLEEQMKNANKSKETSSEALDKKTQLTTTRRNRRNASQDADLESCTTKSRVRHHKVEKTTSHAKAGTVSKIEEDVDTNLTAESHEQNNMNEKQKVAEESMVSTEESCEDHKIKGVDHVKGSEHPETTKHNPVAKRVRRKASQETTQEEDSNNQHSRRCRRIVTEAELPAMEEKVPSSRSRSQNRIIIEEKVATTKSEQEEEKFETNPEKSNSENAKLFEDSSEVKNSSVLEMYGQNPPKKCIKRPFATSDTTCASSASEEPVTRRLRHEGNATENEEDINEEFAAVSSVAKQGEKSEPSDKLLVSESGADVKQSDKLRKAPTRRKAAVANSNEEDKKPIARSRRGQKALVHIDPGHQADQSDDQCGHDKKSSLKSRRGGRKAQDAKEPTHDNDNFEDKHSHDEPSASRSRKGHKANDNEESGTNADHSEDQHSNGEKLSSKSRRGAHLEDQHSPDEKSSSKSEDQHGNDEKSSSRPRRYRKAQYAKEPTHDNDNFADKRTHDEPSTSRSRKGHKANDNKESGTNADHSEDQQSNDEKLSSKSRRAAHLEDQHSPDEKSSSKSQTDIKTQHDERPKQDDHTESLHVLDEKSSTRSRRGRKSGGDEEPGHQENHDNQDLNEMATTSSRRGRKAKDREETDHQDHHTDNQHDHDEKSSVKSARRNKAHEDDKNANQNDQHGHGENTSPRSRRGRKVHDDVEESANQNDHPDENSKSTKIKVAVTHEESVPAIRRRGRPRKMVDHEKELDANISSGDITLETKESSKRSNRRKKDEPREVSSTTYKEPSDDQSSSQSLHVDTKSHRQKESPSNQDVSKTHTRTESQSDHDVKVTHTKHDELNTTSEDSPSKRERSVPQRRAATRHHSYDETSDSDKTDKRKKKAESPRKFMEAAKSTHLETIALESSSVPSPTLSSSAVTARGRTRKPTARVQQFLEKERAKTETPKKRAGALATAVETPTKGKLLRRGAKAIDTETEVVGTPQTNKQTRGRAAPIADESQGREEHISPTTAKGRKGSRKVKADVHAKHSDDTEEPPAKKSPAVLEAEKEKFTPPKNEAPTPTRVAGRRNAAAAAKFRIEEDALATAAIDPPKKSKAKKQPAKATAISEKRDHRLVSASTVEDDENPEQLTNPTKEETKTAIKRGGTRKATSAATETTGSTAVGGLPAKKSRKGKAVTETHESDTEPTAVTKSNRSAATTRGGLRNVHFESADQNTEDEPATTKKHATRVLRK